MRTHVVPDLMFALELLAVFGIVFWAVAAGRTGGQLIAERVFGERQDTNS